ncbi:MAG: 2-oxoacid:acceptor oxidoreductase family protein [Thermodesulfobacteriota bacterium]
MSLAHDPYNLIVCGVGGQGNILIARLIGRILARQGCFLTIGETFGAAQRGGSVFSSMRISRQGYLGPLIPQGQAHLILSMEPLETLRMLSLFGNDQVQSISNTQSVLPVGVLAGRSQYPPLARLQEAISELSARAWFVDATVKAVELGAPIVSNIVLLGALLGSGALPVSPEEVRQEMESTFPAGKLALNQKALNLGMEALQAH